MATDHILPKTFKTIIVKHQSVATDIKQEEVFYENSKTDEMSTLTVFQSKIAFDKKRSHFFFKKKTKNKHLKATFISD